MWRQQHEPVNAYWLFFFIQVDCYLAKVIAIALSLSYYLLQLTIIKFKLKEREREREIAIGFTHEGHSQFIE